MVTDIPFRQFPTTTRLFADFLYDFQKVEPFLGRNFRDERSFSAVAEKVLAGRYPRQKAAAILTEQNRAFGSGRKTFENLERFEKTDSLAVFGGQQGGLFGGPIFTLYKAWTVLHLAEKLERHLGRPVIPFFWMAGDDHDFAEVNCTCVVNKNNHLTKLEYSPLHPPQGLPMGRVRFDESIAATLKQWEDGFNPSDFKNEVFEKLSFAYRAGRSFPEAFAFWMNQLLGNSGLVWVNPNDSRLKELAADFFVLELGLDGTSQAKVAGVNERLRDSHYHVQVHKTEELLNLFYQPEKRETVRKSNGGFITETGRRFSAAELQEKIRRSPGDFSPNVLLRPVLQSHLFPVVAAVLGPSEVAYFAQIGPLFELHKLPFPVLWPRKSVTLLEGRVANVLKKQNLSVLDFAGDAEALLGRLVRESAGKVLETSSEAARQAVREAVERFKADLVGIDPTLEKTAEQAKAKFDLELQNLEKKGIAAAKRKNDVLREQIYRTKELLFPEGVLQERVINATYFLVKYGFDLLPQIKGQINFENFDHQAVNL
ncbi:MAG: bacillithiol biosynthesis cysteine-adding enzyme BshC [candidate division Zixibacteria bacterium]|nr:bacillithiol biosynthesis cysteine-adding enzyme BshC [candidate division Zixibacteria bacterium]MCI0595440.1 bacillithiol biosynthesis cysteine-adding enzyme BshC [candidate division Zixibacteria bacterium]